MNPNEMVPLQSDLAIGDDGTCSVACLTRACPASAVCSLTERDRHEHRHVIITVRAAAWIGFSACRLDPNPPGRRRPRRLRRPGPRSLARRT